MTSFLKLPFILVLFFTSALAFSQVDYDEYFYEHSLRINLLRTGNSVSDSIHVVSYSNDPFWSRGTDNLIEPFDYGRYRLKVFDESTGTLIFTQSYCNLFQEWQTTSEAKTKTKTFEESVVMPFPKKDVKLEFYSRNKMGIFELQKNLVFNPDTLSIIPNKFEGLAKVNKIYVNGNYSEKLDVVILPDGYGKNDSKKMLKDANQLVADFFSYDPYKEYTDKVNFWLVELVSEESGVDIPTKNVYKKTALNSSYNTFESERYLTSESYFLVKEAAALTPYDQIIILANSDMYGGGGIYNFYAVTVSDNEHSAFLTMHEWGHSFAGLADEYSGDVTYDYFFSLDVEPWQPNITTLIDFEKKWFDMVSDTTVIPTDDVKKNKDVIGAYEGAGYAYKGVYRPKINCSMRSVSENNFCEVCQKAIRMMLGFYSKE